MTRDRTILLIEDSDTQALMLSHLLEEGGMSVCRAATAEEGLQQLGSHRPDLIVVDYHLPGMCGDEFCRLVRDNDTIAKIPLLILTEESESGAERHGLDCGADDYVSKSIDSDILLARVELLLRRSQGHAPANEGDRSLFTAQQILLVDDSPTYLTFLEGELRHEGYSVLAAASGADALEIAASERIDCLVVDLVMPGMDGIELCRRMDAVRRHGSSLLPILVVTSKGSKEKMMEALEVGADDYVEKSGDATVLKARIRTLLRRKMLHDQHARVQQELRAKEMENVRERSERKAVEARAQIAEQLEVANRELEETNRELKETQIQLVHSAKMASLGSLVAGIAHEVNNPLAYSMSHLGTVAKALDGIGRELETGLSQPGLAQLQKARTRTADVAEGLKRVEELMTKLRTFSRLDEGSFKTTDIRECIESALPLVRHRLSDAVHVETDYAPDNVLFCAPGTLNQVVLNLLTNAIDAVGDEGRIRLSTHREDRHFLLRVADSGPGIDQEMCNRVFEPFFTTKEVGKGTGMGLAISYQIVERHGGRIDVGRSDYGGAEFTVRIPTNLAEKIDAA